MPQPVPDVPPSPHSDAPVRLKALRQGARGERPPLVVAHGLFGSARNWGAVARRLSADREVIAVDLRNHGDSPHAPVHDYAALAADLAAVIAAEGGRADLLGHSMGGKAAMALALAEPECVGRLIVVDIAPVRYAHSQIDLVRAMQSVDLGRVARRADADAMLAEAAPDPALRAFLLQSLAIGPGGARWRLNLAALGAEMPRIMDFPPVQGRFPGSALFLTGGASDYVQDAHWPSIAARFPAAERVVLSGAGHWLHAEALVPFAAAVTAFLDR